MEGEKEGISRSEKEREDKDRTEKDRNRKCFFYYSEGHGNYGYWVCVNQKPTADSDVKTETKL